MENRIANLSVKRAVITFLLKKETRGTGLSLIGTIVGKFFLPQFSSKFRVTNREIIKVDHTLDRLIPFSSTYLPTYMSFTKLWIQSIYFVLKEFGAPSLPFIRQFLEGLKTLYITGSTVYDTYLSTTQRPKSGKNIPLKLVHMADPHLHCFPSLHVMIVSYTYIKISGYIDTAASDPEEYGREKDYLFSEVVNIIDSVLFLKQHSVNCIPAGFFALRSTIKDFPEEFPYTVAKQMLKTSGLSHVSQETVRHYITELYSTFLKQSSGTDDVEVLIDFLRNYRQID